MRPQQPPSDRDAPQQGARQDTAAPGPATAPPEPATAPPGSPEAVTDPAGIPAVPTPDAAAEPPPVAQTTHPAPAPRPAGKGRAGRVRRSRFGGIWVGIVIAAIVLVLLLIFIVQNTTTVTIHFFGAAGGLPVAVAMLLSAVCGVLLVAIPGTVRILQLRKEVRRAGKSDISPQ